VNNSN